MVSTSALASVKGIGWQGYRHRFRHSFCQSNVSEGGFRNSRRRVLQGDSVLAANRSMNQVTHAGYGVPEWTVLEPWLI